MTINQKNNDRTRKDSLYTYRIEINNHSFYFYLRLEIRTSASSDHNTPSEPLNNSSNLSPAERYINQQAQRLFDQNSPQGVVTSIGSSTSSVRHAVDMNEWHKKEVDNVYKHEPHRYKYGKPSTNFHRTDSSSSTSRTKKN